MPNTTLKAILLQIVEELEDIKAMQFVLANKLGQGTSPSQAQDAIDLAKVNTKAVFEKLRNDVASLP